MNYLTIDLNQQTIHPQALDPQTQAAYLGGRGLGARYLFDHLPPDTDPLSPQNILSLWTSPLIGSGAISMVKTCVVTKSPATGTILMSLMGGYFAPELRFAGVEGLTLHGAAEEPVYLLVRDGTAEIRPARHLWGLTTSETEKALAQELGGGKRQVACIGPAGENGVLFASIMHSGDASGRGGAGAVIGAKKVKAIVASGKQRPAIHDPQRFKRVLQRVIQGYQQSQPLKLFGATGTTRHVDGLNARRIYPTRNFQSNYYEQHKQVNAEQLYKNFVRRRVTCHTCSVRCRREAVVSHPQQGEISTEGPEYETLWGFGGNLDNASLETVILANELCSQYGLDTISTGMVISFAMECYENGLLSQEDTGGLELTFGNSRAILDLIPQIARREATGKLLSLGTRRAAEIIGNGAQDFAMQVKGLEMAGYDPRGAKGMGLGYATSPRGACHERGYLLSEVVLEDPNVDRYQEAGKGSLVKITQDTVAVKDALGFCVLSSAGTTLPDMAEMFSAATGIEMTEASLLAAGERICNLERLFNLRAGFTRQDDRLPSRFLQQALPGIDGTQHQVDLETMLDDYYHARGWDQQGVPLPATLERLGLP